MLNIFDIDIFPSYFVFIEVLVQDLGMFIPVCI